ncbi:MAG: helix-turn-helix domain-containing protein [Rhizomicrobium sp.]
MSVSKSASGDLAEPHLSQHERSARMKDRLLEATLQCLAEKGYAGTSTTEVVKRAGVSRGALAHHFASKAELVAEAAAYLISNRIRYTDAQMQAAADRNASLESQLRVVWKAYEKWFPANIEFMVAARTDPDLRASFSRMIAQYDPGQRDETAGKQPSWSDADGDPSPLLTRYAIGCFVRGLCLESIVNDAPLVEEIFAKFASILALALDAMRHPAKADTGAA